MEKMKRLLRQILGYFPSKLPEGTSEFETWLSSIVSTYDLPTKLDSDIRYVLSTAIINLPSGVTKRPKLYFVRLIRSAAIKQVASFMFQEMQRKVKEEAAKQAAEVSNGQGQ